MDRYETSIPRVAFGIAALAMAAITIGVSVVVPATMATESKQPRTLAASKPATQESMGFGTAVSQPDLAAAPCTSSNSNRKPEG